MPRQCIYTQNLSKSAPPENLSYNSLFLDSACRIKYRLILLVFDSSHRAILLLPPSYMGLSSLHSWHYLFTVLLHGNTHTSYIPVLCRIDMAVVGSLSGYRKGYLMLIDRNFKYKHYVIQSYLGNHTLFVALFPWVSFD